MALSSTETAADALCKRCGLCCDGTLFGSVIIQPEEQPALRRVGLRVVDYDGELLMNQRCSALAGCLCDVYADRPLACVQYECTLRKRVLAGTRTEEQGHADIARMRALLATLASSFDVPESDTVSVWEALIAIEEPATFDIDSDADKRQEAGIEALSEILELGRSAFEPEFSG